MADTRNIWAGNGVTTDQGKCMALGLEGEIVESCGGIALPTPTPDWSDVGVLYHFDDTTGSHTQLNSRTGQRTLVANDAQIVTGEGKFGTSCAYFPGSTNAFFSNGSPNTTNWQKGNTVGLELSKFTYECWAKIDALTGDVMGCVSYETTSADRQDYLGFDDLGRPRYHQGRSGAILQSSTTVPVGEWVHIAVSADVPTARLYLNGVEQDSTASMQAIRTNTGNSGRIGVSKNTFGSWEKPFKGWIDEVRYTNADLYTVDFSVPTEAFPNA